MIDKLQGLNNIAGLSMMQSLGECKCRSNNSNESGMFNMVIENLLIAIKSQNKREETSKNREITNNALRSFNNISINNENINSDEKISVAIVKASKKYKVDENLIRAVIKVESNFKKDAVSQSGAMGLMQIMPSNFEALGITEPLNIEQNIDGGTKLLKQYLDRYNGDAEMALMAYNGGPTRMMNRGVTSVNDIYKMPKETQNYVPKVMKYYRGV